MRTVPFRPPIFGKIDGPLPRNSVAQVAADVQSRLRTASASGRTDLITGGRTTLPIVVLRGTRVVFPSSVFRQAWFSCHVHGAALQASDMKHGRQAAGALPRGGILWDHRMAIRKDILTDRKEVL
ncbi:hypothetical protein AMC87_PA00211 (plasmid) [Rhizobium phaseoli]|nr:hypothetical protein AMC87_PA00211 [Rhizobium phaseoli]KKZ85354.1 hypothetical protein RPHASCH2410_PA01145 [Rhizobium phaseoli Ch24-10]